MNAYFLFAIFIFTINREANCLKNVSLLILPPSVQRGQNATLICQYDLEGAPLYSVKWYRGRHEFYRYSPNEIPQYKIFPFPGFHVDLSESNSSQVTLQEVGFHLSGNFSCEITTDAPYFLTAIVSRPLMVVDFPAHGPVVTAEKERYEVGEILRANCTSAPSVPPASLSFMLNNIPIGYPEQRLHPKSDFLQSTSISISEVLVPSYFNNGQLALRCTSLVANLLRESVVLQLGSPQSEPIPERVTSPNDSLQSSSPSPFVMLLLVVFHFAR